MATNQDAKVFENYQIADLSDKLVEDIQHLESKMKDELGDNITLIAYTKQDVESEGHERSSVTDCRAGLED